MEILSTAFGSWQVHHDQKQLYQLSWLGQQSLAHTNPLSSFSQQLESVIQSYENNGLTLPQDIPIANAQTPFQSRVFDYLKSIPFAQTRTYAEVAHALNTSPRAVGQACGKNPVLLFIPCHRIVAKTGIGGFMGKTNQVNFKQTLLTHEQTYAAQAVNT